jgi:hypothetical protein
MHDQHCLTSAIARRSALTAGPSSSYEEDNIPSTGPHKCQVGLTEGCLQAERAVVPAERRGHRRGGDAGAPDRAAGHGHAPARSARPPRLLQRPLPALRHGPHAQGPCLSAGHRWRRYQA